MANDSGGTLLGVAASGRPGDVRLSDALRNRHLYVIGKTRTGKTTALLNLVAQDIGNDNGFAFIDPAGDAAEAILRIIPSGLINSTLYLNAADAEHPLAFNVLDLPYPPHKLTEDLVAVFRNLTGDGSWGPRMEHLLRQSLFTLLLADGRPYTIADLRRLLVDEAWRDRIVASVRDEETRRFWRTEFAEMPAGAASPILNKLSGFLLPGSPLRALLTSKKNKLDIRGMMDGGGMFIVNLAKGTLGEEPARLLGGLLVTAIQQEALARAARPADERRNFYLYVDEFQNFAVPSFGTILAESAKYRLNLTLAHQTLAQVPTELYGLITGNVGTMLAFQVSGDDARHLTREMCGTVWDVPVIRAYEIRGDKDGGFAHTMRTFKGRNTVRITRDFLQRTFVPDLTERIAMQRDGAANAQPTPPPTEQLPMPMHRPLRPVPRLARLPPALRLPARAALGIAVKGFDWLRRMHEYQSRPPGPIEWKAGRWEPIEREDPAITDAHAWADSRVGRLQRLIDRIETDELGPALFEELSRVLPTVQQYGLDFNDAKCVTWPEADDLANLAPFTAFLRTERAGNVQLIETLGPPRLADGLMPVPEKIRAHSIAHYGADALTETPAVPTLPINDEFLAYEEPRGPSPIPDPVEARAARPRRTKARRGKATPSRESS